MTLRPQDLIADLIRRQREMLAGLEELATVFEEEIAEQVQDRLAELCEPSEHDELRIVDVHRGSQSESWLVVHRDGRIQLHTENDGCRFLRHGAEAQDCLIDMSEVRVLSLRHRKDLVGAVETALAEMAAPKRRIVAERGVSDA